MSDKPRRHPGVHDAHEERVLLVTKNTITGAERVDWWPSVEEAEDSNLKVLEVRRKITVPRRKTNWKGLKSLLYTVLGKSGTQDFYVHERNYDQKEFFEVVNERHEKK